MSSSTLFIQSIPVAFAALFPVVNPVGTAIILTGMTHELDVAARRQVALKVAINSALLLIMALLVGSYVLAFFGITVPVVQTGGGLVLAAMGWKMLNQKDGDAGDGKQPVLGSGAGLSQMLFYPFTFPITVGPGCIAVALTLSAHTQHGDLMLTMSHQGGAIVGILAVCLLFYLAFAHADLLSRRLGSSGTNVMLRMMAFVVVCIGVEIFWNGASTLLKAALIPTPAS